MLGRMRATLALLALPLLLAPFAACGDDDDDDTNRGTSGRAGAAGRAGASGVSGAGGSSNGSAGTGTNGSAGSGSGASGSAGASGAGGSAGAGGAGGSAGASGAGGSGGAPLPGEPTLTKTTWVGGLSNPWDIAFLPGTQSALITERAGKVSLVDAAGNATAVAGPSDVLAVGEGGLLGLALAPKFTENRNVYTCFSHQGGGNDNRVVRWRLSDDNARLEERADIVTGMPYSTGRHSGCRLLFGTDGYLYVGTGDAAIGPVPQDTQSLGGKVLRVDRNGAAAPGNPSTNPPKDPRVFTYGHRNIQGLALQPGTGRIYSGEHGSNIEDEINLIRPGMNGGWNPVPIAPGDPPYTEATGPQQIPIPMTNLSLPNAVAPVWISTGGTYALSGITFLNHNSWRDWTGAIAGAELANRALRIIRLSEDGLSTTELAVRFDNVRRLRTPVLGPEGALYVATDRGGDPPGSDEIWRIVAQ